MTFTGERVSVRLITEILGSTFAIDPAVVVKVEGGIAVLSLTSKSYDRLKTELPELVGKKLEEEGE